MDLFQHYLPEVKIMTAGMDKRPIAEGPLADTINARRLQPPSKAA